MRDCCNVYSTTTATPIDAHAVPALLIYGSGACKYSQAQATVESVFSPGTAASVMARPGTLCIATVTVLVILTAAVQPGAVEYIPRGGSMGSMEPPLLKGCLGKYYAQTCARTLVTPFTNSSLRLGMSICYISV